MLDSAKLLNNTIHEPARSTIDKTPAEPNAWNVTTGDKTIQSEKLPVFICYRRTDGGNEAQYLYQLLQGQLINLSDRQQVKLEVFLDTQLGAVGDWKAHLQPALMRAQSMIVVLTPGVAADLSENDSPDYVQDELKWWREHREAEPLIVDATGEGARWLPRFVRGVWANVNRIPLDLDQIPEAGPDRTTRDGMLLELVAQGIRDNAGLIRYQDIEHLKALNLGLKRRARLAFAVALLAAGLLLWALSSQNTARENAARARENEVLADEQAAEAKRQKGIADKEAAEAKRQKALADEQAAEAKRQKGIADKEAAEAKRQKALADEQADRARTQARKATARRLGADESRLAKAKTDTALLLMAQAYRMDDNAAVRESWWRLLSEPRDSVSYLRDDATDLFFELDGRLMLNTNEGLVSYSARDGFWRRTGLENQEFEPSEKQLIEEGCDDRSACNDNKIWRCVKDDTGVPYQELCLRSRIIVPEWCGQEPIEVPGGKVVIRQYDDWITIHTNAGKARFICLSNPQPQPTLITGEPEFFLDSEAELEPFLVQKGQAAVRVSQSLGRDWLALLREDGSVDVQQRRDKALASRLGVAKLDLPASAEAIVSTENGAIAVALSPTGSQKRGEVLFWRDHSDAVAGRRANWILPEIWPMRNRSRLLALSRDGERLALGVDISLEIWSSSRREQISEKIDLGRNAVTDAVFSVDGRLISAVERPLDTTLSSRAIVFNHRGRVMPGRFGSGVQAVLFDPAMPDTLITAGDQGVTRWQLRGQVDVETLDQRPTDRLVLDLDRRIVGISLQNGSLAIRSPAGYTETSTARTEGRANSLAFLSFGHALVRASASGLAAWDWVRDSWSMIDGKPHIAVVSLPNGLILALAAEHSQAAKEGDYTAFFYDLNSDNWLKMTCDLVGRNLSRREWDEHVGKELDYECTCVDFPPGDQVSSESCRA